MRLAYKDVDWISEGDTLTGVCLGYDFCAEHEMGTTEMNETLGIWRGDPSTENKVWGFDRHRITAGDNVRWVEGTVKIVPEGKKRKASVKAYGIALYKSWKSEEESEKYLKAFMLNNTYDWGKTHLKSAWDRENFFLWSDDKEKMELLYMAFQANRMAKGALSQNNPFGGNGPVFLISDYLTDEEAVVATQKDYRNMWKQVYRTKVFKKLKRAKCGFYSCEPKRISFETNASDEDGGPTMQERQRKSKLKDIAFWLNPREQDKNKYGWYTVEELLQWANGKGPVVKKDK